MIHALGLTNIGLHILPSSFLFRLGDVIHALGQKDKGGHVPFRNSKLTYLLSDSLSGNSKVLMFVNVSPVQDNFMESVCSLNFAKRCRRCVNPSCYTLYTPFIHPLYTLYTPFIHPLYAFITMFTPIYTHYTCIYIIYTPYIHLTHL